MLVQEAKLFSSEMYFSNKNIKLERKSQDLIVNSNGRNLIDFFDEMSYIILNGRFAGDDFGKLTFCGAMGQSTIDYCTFTPKLLDYVSQFEVGDFPYSDHFPLILNIGISNNCVSNNVLLPKIRWYHFKNDYYAGLLGQLTSNISDNNQLTPSILVENITDIGKEFNNNNKKKIIREPWFDKECVEKRSETFQFLNLLRKYYSSEVYKKFYLKSCQNYKDI